MLQIRSPTGSGAEPQARFSAQLEIFCCFRLWVLPVPYCPCRESNSAISFGTAELRSVGMHACTHAVVDLTFSGDITIDRIGDLGRGPRDFVAFGREEPRRQSVCAVRGISRSQLVLNRFARCLARHCLRWALVGGSAGCSGRACAFISHAINTVFMNTTHHQRDFAH